MMRIKKLISLVLACVMAVCAISACTTQKTTNVTESTADKIEVSAETETEKSIKIVATIFPIYDIVRNIMPSEGYELTLLLDSGIDIHNFSPTANDIAKLAETDLFIYIGGESDSWVDSTIAASQNHNIKMLNLMEALSDVVKTEEMVEGMQHEHEEHEHEEHEYELENDEHIWLSVRNAKEMTRSIATFMGIIDRDNADAIQKKADEYISRLEGLDEMFASVAKSKKFDTLLFGDRFPFRYLVDDYGIKYYAAFSGCSAEAEASFETVAFLAKKMDDLKLKHICALKGPEPKVAKTIINTSNNKNVDIVLFNSMEGITNTQDAANTNYLKIMEENLEAFSKALN